MLFPVRDVGHMRRPILICVLLALATLAVYWPVAQFEFVDYDDQAYVTQNNYVARGLTWEGVQHAFSDRVLEYWQPVTLISHMVDCQLFGVTPAAPHLINLAFHLANTLLLFLLLRRMTKRDWPSAMVAALFALHPLHVESVAWIAERKDVLSTFFWCLTLWFYLNYVERKRRRDYAVALLFFGLGLLSKSMVVTLPCLLLLMDFWPLNRIALLAASELPKNQPAFVEAWRNTSSTLRIWVAQLVRLLAEKVPFFLLTLAVSFVTFHWQKTGGSFISSDSLPLYLRAANAFVSYSRYLGKTFWPTDLVMFYPHPGLWPSTRVVGAILLFAGVTWLALSQIRSRPYLTVGWLWFVGLLVPTIGLVQAGWQSLADHFTYVPLTGIFLMLVWGAAELAHRWSLPRRAYFGLAVITLGACAIVTRAQMEHWRNSYNLFSHAVASTRNNAVAEMGLGNALLKRGQRVEALQHLREAVRIYPYFTDAYVNLAGALADTGDLPAAETAYRKALSITPGNISAHFGLANILLNRGAVDDAITHYRAVLKSKPDMADVHYDLGNALMQQGLLPEARQEYEQALHLAPDLEEAHFNLGTLFARLGQPEAAEQHLLQAQRLHPKDPGILGALAFVNASAGKIKAAAGYYGQWIQLNPQDPQPHYQLALLALNQGQEIEAIQQLNQALQLKPGNIEPLFLLARIKATSPNDSVRNGAEAVRLAEEANRLSGGKKFVVLDTLAAAYAETGQFPAAISTAQKAASLARLAGQSNLAAAIEARMKLYQSGKPFRETGSN